MDQQSKQVDDTVTNTGEVEAASAKESEPHVDEGQEARGTTADCDRQWRRAHSAKTDERGG